MDNLVGRYLMTTEKFKPHGKVGAYWKITKDDPDRICVQTKEWGSTSRKRFEEDSELVLMPIGFNPDKVNEEINNTYMVF